MPFCGKCTNGILIFKGRVGELGELSRQKSPFFESWQHKRTKIRPELTLCTVGGLLDLSPFVLLLFLIKVPEDSSSGSIRGE
jgi:hypothetical protein